MSDLPKIGLREMDALAECKRYTARHQFYFWREASMAKLLAHGLVEIHPDHKGARRLTAAGEAALDQRAA